MPIVDEYTQRTDRRPRSWWPWLLACIGAVGLWLVLAVTLPMWFYTLRRAAPATPMVSAAAQYNSSIIQQAQSVQSYTGPAQVTGILDGVNPNAPMATMDKHTYFRVGGKAYTQGGNPHKGAQLYERFLAFGLQVKSAECASCHAGSSAIPPGQSADMLKSTLGKSYVAALKAANEVESRRATLETLRKKRPNDPEANLLLYHIDTALKRKDEAAACAARVRKP